jgi:putative Mn2+ efflux pump MntP
MNLIEIIITSIALAVDCMIVSAVCGSQPYCKKKSALIMAIFFGGFQSIMLLLGAWLGAFFSGIMSSIDHWISFALLFVIGLKMILNAIKKEEKTNFRIDKISVLIVLSIATSIDAFVVGLSYGLLNSIKISHVAIVFAGSFLLSLFGFFVARKSKIIKPRISQVLGGLVLIALGVKILIEHLFF